MIALLFAVICSPYIACDHCDMIEKNHYYDSQAKPVFDQIIFWRWDHGKARYEVRAWFIDDPRSPVFFDRLRNVTQFFHDGLRRQVTTHHYKESWTQHDPERCDKQNCQEGERVALTRLSIPILPPVLPEVE